MPTEECSFEEIAMDFIGELPHSEGFNASLVIIDQFTKVQHHILAKRTWTLENIVDSYINYIRRLFGLV